MPLKPEQITQLDLASQRVASGKAGAAAGANAGDVANLEYAAKQGYKYDPNRAGTSLANAVSEVGTQPSQASVTPVSMVSLVNKDTGQKVSVSKADWETNPSYKGGPWGMEATPETMLKGESSISDFLKSAFGDMPQISATDMTADKDRLESARADRIKSLDVKYAQDLARLQTQNKDAENALKARLVKLGVNPSDSSWSNAEAGQLQRNRDAEARLSAEYEANKSAIQSDIDAKISNISMQENSQKFNAQVQNLNNWLTRVGQGLNLFQIFSQRDQSEKDREQQAYNTLLDYQGTMATLDQNKQIALTKSFMENAQKGFYNIADKGTLEMLAKMERDNPQYLTGLVDVATSGLTDRLANLAQTQAQTAAANRSNRGGSGDDDKETKAFYEDVDEQLGKLSTGKTDWGTAFSTLKSKYGAPDDIIDTLLNKELWSQPGAYEEQLKTRKADQPFTFVLPTN